jgi:GDP-4-dehydro-6-deoxy-D-mannose reductase
MDKIMILGINGFSGRHFQHYILDQNFDQEFEFVGIDKNIGEHVTIKSVELDLTIKENLENIICDQKPDYIINMIGLFGGNDLESMIQINAGISRNIFETVVINHLSVQKILLIGSAAEYGVPISLPVKEDHGLNPINPYGLSKVIQTTFANYYALNFDIPVTVARTFNILGAGLSSKLSIGSFAEQIRELPSGSNINVGNIDSKRDFLDIYDVIDAYWKILLHGKKGEIYNVCSGKSISIKSLVEFLIQQSGKNLEIQVKPELLRKNDIADFYGDNSKLSEQLNWSSSRSIEESLTSMI